MIRGQMIMRKKMLSPIILLLLTITLLNAPTNVYAVESPYIAVVPSAIVDDTLDPGDTFTISIYTDYTGNDITGYQFTLTYNASVLNGVNVANGDLITNDTSPLNRSAFLPGTFNNTEGTLSLTGAFFFFIDPPPDTATGPGTLANVTFQVVGTGTSAITLGGETQLIGWNGDEEYIIIDAIVMFTHIQHGFFDNTEPPPPTYPPVAVITAPSIAYFNETVAFSGEDSYDPDGGVIKTYFWDFGDGANSTDAETAHTYLTLGIYTVTLVVTDDEEESGLTMHTLEITIRPVAGLVKWRVKPESHHWDYSKDDNGLISITALARNRAAIEVNVTVVFAIIDTRYGGTAGPPIVDERTLAVGPDVPITVELNPYDYGYDGTTRIFFAHVQLWYYDLSTETNIPTKPKVVRITVVP